ncbi:MAG: VWA domain-containing protein, partial [Acidimicrobiia bacterium]
MIGALTGFVDELREVGVPVSMVESIDAMRAVESIDLSNRVALRETLRATLIKNLRHERAFDTAFDVYFSRLPPPLPSADPDDTRETHAQAPMGGQEDFDLDDLIRSLLDALEASDAEGLRAGAQRAVDRLAGMEPGRPVGGTYYLYRTLRRLDMARLEEMLLEALADDGEMSEFDRRLLREDVAARLETLRRQLEEEIRRRLVADRGRQAVARTLRKPMIEDVDLMHATTSELAEMEAAIGPLTRKLAARLARRRKRRSGRLDFRKTVRRSLATGGVPADPQFKHPRPHRPEVWLICDISGSMATFSRFTLQFTHAMSSQFSRLRSFAFVDTVDEVTDFFGPGIDFGSALHRITTEAEVIWMDGHSDYGNTFETFLARYGSQISPRT